MVTVRCPSNLELVCNRIRQHSLIAVEVKGRTIERSRPGLDFIPEKLEEWSLEQGGEPFLVYVRRSEKNERVSIYFIPFKKARELTEPLPNDPARLRFLQDDDLRKIRSYLVFEGQVPRMMKEAFQNLKGKALALRTEMFAEDLARIIFELLDYEVTFFRRTGDGVAKPRRY